MSTIIQLRPVSNGFDGLVSEETTLASTVPVEIVDEGAAATLLFSTPEHKSVGVTLTMLEIQRLLRVMETLAHHEQLRRMDSKMSRIQRQSSLCTGDSGSEPPSM